MALLPNEKLITTKEAGELSGYTSDYLSRLVRSGKIAGKKVGHSWLVDTESLNRFLGEQDDHKSDRARELARARAREYRVHRSVVLRAAKALTEPRSMPQQFVRMMSALPSRAALRRLRSHALALSVALLVLTFGTLGAQAEMLPRLAQNAAAVAEQTALGLEATFGDIPSHIAQRFTDVEREMRTHFSRTATTGTAVSARIAPRVLRNLSVSLSFGQPETTSSDRAAFSIRAASASKAAVPAVTAGDIRAFAADAHAVFTSPSRVTDAAANAYASVGEEAYGAIRAALAAYRSTLDESGARTLSAAAVARDTLRAAPAFVARTNLALGESVIAAARFVLDAEIAASYGLAAAAPASARATVAIVGGTGDLLAGGTVRAAAEVPSRLARALLDASEAGAKVPEAVFSAEYAAATGFIDATNAVSGRYALALARIGEVGYEGVRGSRALVQSIPAEIRHPRQLQPSDLEHAGAAIASAVSDAYRGSVALVLRSLGEVGRTPKVAAVLNSPPMRALRSAGEAGLAATLPALSAGEKAALAVYTAIHGLFTFATDSLANLFMPPPTIVYPVAAPARPRVVTAPPPRASNSYTTIVRGVSEDFVQQSLNSLRSSLLATIADSIRPVYMQTVTNAGTIQMVNKIEDLHDLIVRNGDFRNSIFDNGIRVSATDGRFTNLYGGSASLTSLTVSGATSLATTTVTGDLSVSGTITPSVISAGTSISAPYFVATSTTATSTFAGSLAIDTNGFVYATSTKNVGIGVLSPAALLAIQNSTSTQPIFVASSAAGAEVYRITNAGFVGIGTTTPGYNLAVEGSSSLGNQAIAGYFTATSTTATSTFAGRLAVGTSTPWGDGLFTVGVTTPLLYISSNTGRIGVGTSSPSVAFDVFATSAIRLPVGTSAQRPSTGDVGYVRFNTTTHQFEGYGDNSVWQGLGGVIDADQDTYVTADTNNTDEDTLRFFTFGSERMTITPTGNIGVATTSPYAKLSLHANNGETNTTLFSIASSTASATSTLFSILNTGRIGVGTASPSTIFHISGTDGLIIPNGTTAQRPTTLVTGTVRYNSETQQFEGYGTSSWGSLGGVIDVDQDTKITAEDSAGADNDQLKFFTLGSERMRIDSNGLIGMGTTTPFANLSIAGSAGGTTNLFAISTSTSLFATTTALTIDQNGNLSLLNGANLTVGGNTIHTGTLTQTGLATFTNGFLSNASSTITSGLFTMSGGASTTNFTASGTASTTNLIASASVTFQNLVGMLSSNGTSGTSARTLTGTANQITIANGDGTGGNPTFSLPSLLSLTNASTSQLSVFQRAYFGGTSTTTIDSAGSITLPTVALLTAPYASTTMLTATTASTTYLIASASVTFQNLIGMLSSNGTSGTSARTLTGTANQITIANGDGTGGNPTFSLPSLLFITNASSTALSSLDYVSVGRTATTTFVGDYGASSVRGSVTVYGNTTSGAGSSLTLERGSTNGDNSLIFNDQTGSPLLKLYTSANTGYSYLNGQQSFLSLGMSVGGEVLRIDTSNNARFTGNVIPSANQQYDLGTAAVYWNNAYINNVVANNLSSASTSIAGTNTTSFSINSNNPTSDAQDMSLIFYRGAGAPSNAVLSWNSTLKRFEFNQNAYIANASASTGSTTLRVAAVAGQTGALTSWLDSSGNVLSTMLADGSLGIGTSSPYAMLSVAGQTVAQNFTATSTTATNTFPIVSMTSATSTNFFASRLTANTFSAGQTASTTIDASGNLSTAGTLQVTGQTTLATSLSGLLQGASGVVSAITGTAGQFPYYNGTNTLLATSSIFLATSGNVGIGTTGPSALLHALSTTEQLRLGYDASNYSSFTTGSTGNLTVDVTGTTITVNDRLNVITTLATGSTIASADFAAGGAGAVAAAQTQAELQINGSATIGARIQERGSTNASLTANAAHVSHIIGAQAVTEASSGVHPFLGQLALRALSVTGGTATVSDAATLYVEGASNATVSGGNYALWVDDGDVRFDGNVGIGTTSPYAKLSVVGEVVGAYFTATTSTASTFPYASTTMVTATTASTTNLIASAAVTFQNLIGMLSSNGTSGTSARTLTGTANQITIANGDGTAGNPTFSLPSLLAFTNASTSQLSVFQKAYFGATATSTFDSAGNLSVGGTLTVAGLCVTGDTRLRRRRKAKKGEEDGADEDGYIYDEVAIMDIKSGDEIQSLDEKTGALVWSRVKHLAYMGKKQTYKLTTASGKTIRTTANHPYLTDGGWKKVSELKEGMNIAVPRTQAKRTYAFVDAANILYRATDENGWKTDMRKLITYLKTRYGAAEVFYYAGVDNKNSVQIGLYAAMERWGYRMRLNPIKRFINASGEQYVKADVDARLAFDAMKYAGEYDRAVFLTGDGDFYWLLEHLRQTKEVKLIASPDKTARELKKLFGTDFVDLDSLNKILAFADKNNATDTFDVSVAGLTYASYTGEKRKSSAWSEGVDIAYEPIISIKAVAEEDVYDIEVEGTHNFIGNDIVAHNTALFNQASSTLFSNTGTAYFGATATSTFSSAGALTLITPLLVGSGGTGQNTFSSSQLLYGAGSGALQSVATSSLAVGTGLASSGTLGAQVGGNASTISFAAIAANSLWANNTGASAVPTAIATSSLFTWSGTGDVVRTTSPTIATPTFTGLATMASASTTLFSSYGPAYFGATATSTFTSAGRLGVLNSSPSYPIDVTGDINISTGSNYKINGANLSPGSWVASGNDVYNSNSGNIGIGTTTPYSRLSVWGGGTGATSMFELTNSASTTLASVLNDGTVYMKGNVGIGTTSPAMKLVVRGTDNLLLRLEGDTQASLFLKEGDAAADNGFWDINATAERLQFRAVNDANTVASNFMRVERTGTTIDSVSFENGNVGIGTTSPAALLDISVTGQSVGGGLRLTNRNADGQIYELGVGVLATNNDTFTIRNITTSVTPFVIKPDGNVGIGTTGPAAKLQVAGVGATPSVNATTNSNGMLRLRTADAVFMDFGALGASPWSTWIQAGDTTGASYYPIALNPNGGNVGIGTTTPTAILHVISGTSGYAAKFDCTNGGNCLQLGTGGAGKWQYYLSGNDLRLYQEGGGETAEVMTFKAGGNVGIGTTSPSALLTLSTSAGGDMLVLDKTAASQSTINFRTTHSADSNWRIGSSILVASAFEIYNVNAAADRLVIDTSGNVGIGTTGPGAKLHVTGTANNPSILTDGPDATAVTTSVNSPYLGVRGKYWTGVASANRDMYLGNVIDASANYRLGIFDNSGVEKVSIQSGGNVGIGTATPGAKLDVSGGSVMLSTDGSFFRSGANDVATMAVGLKAFGTTIGQYAGIELQRTNVLGGTQKGEVRFFTTDIAGAGEYQQRMVIDHAGNVGIGTTAPDSIKLDVEDDIEIGTGTTGCVRDADNTTLVGTCVSDERLKKNIAGLSAGTLDKLAQLRPVTFEWRNDEFDWLNGQPGINYGLIAQEVEPVFPEMVHTDDRGYKRVSYDIGLTMRMLEGIRELDARTRQILGPDGVLSVVPGVESQCVTGDTRLRRRRKRVDGSFEFDEIEIADVVAGDEVASLDERTGSVVYSRVNALVDMGTQEVFELVTKSGRRIRTTSNHPFLARIRTSDVQVSGGHRMS